MIVAIEGIDGAGKTVLAQRVAQRLQCRFQKFPDYSTPVGALILKMLMADPETVDPLALQALQVVNRIERLDALRAPLVVCDRYTATGVVYGGADRLNQAHVEAMQAALPPADLSVWLCVSPVVCHDRVAHRAQDNRYGQRSLARMEDLHQRYFDLFVGQGSNMITLMPGADESVDSLTTTVINLVKLQLVNE